MWLWFSLRHLKQCPHDRRTKHCVQGHALEVAVLENSFDFCVLLSFWPLVMALCRAADFVGIPSWSGVFHWFFFVGGLVVVLGLEDKGSQLRFPIDCKLRASLLLSSSLVMPQIGGLWMSLEGKGRNVLPTICKGGPVRKVKFLSRTILFCFGTFTTRQAIWLSSSFFMGTHYMQLQVGTSWIRLLGGY